MSRQEARKARRRAEKSRVFFNKVRPWITSVPAGDRRFAYYDLLLFASEQIPLARQDEVLQKAQDLYYEVRQRRR